MTGRTTATTKERGGRPSWAPRVQPDREHLFNTYHLTLAGMTYPAWRMCLLGAVRAACLALLGHVWLALAWLLASWIGDIAVQAILRHWTRQAQASGAARVPWTMALLAAFRSALYMSAPTIAVLQTGGTPEILFLAVMGGYSLLPVALSYGAFSPKVFWGFAAPPVLAFGAVTVSLLGFGPGLALILALSASVWVMAMVSLTWGQSLEIWHRTHDASVEMIRDLEAARDRAFAERVAADEAREAARKAGQAKANFLATMSHEIRTPMNGVLGMAEAMRRAETDPAQLSRLQTLTDSGEYLLSILNDILDMSKIEAGRLDLVFEPEDLPRFLEKVAAFWRPQAEAKGLTLDLHLQEALPRFVKVDAVRLRQVLFNLIGNALKFTEAGSVTLSASAGPVRQGRTRVSIAVTDTGAGIAEDVLPQIFDRYSQGGVGASRRADGSGLGLAVCQQLTELMGGRLRAESVQGLGSTFHLELVLEVAKAGPRAADAEDAGADLRPLRVLAIDDHAVNLTVLRELLGPRGHKVTCAAAAEGLRLAAGQPFDVILMDVHMPTLNGPQALKALRGTDGPNRATPVIALTADVVSRGAAEYRALGFADMTPKPLQAPQLFAAIRRAVARPGKGRVRAA